MTIKSIAICFVMIVPYSTVMAQSDNNMEKISNSRFYIKAFGGYGFFTPGSYKLESKRSYSYQADGNTRDTSIVSFGKNGIGGGLRLGGGLGYIVNNFINIGVDVENLKGVTLKNSVRSDTTLSTSTLNYNVITITPQIVFKAISYSDFYIYNKLGILISLPFELQFSGYDSLMRKERKWVGTNPAKNGSLTSKTIRYSTSKYEIPVSFGLNVALGCQFVIAGNLRGFAEGFANFMVLAPTSYDKVEQYNLREVWTETETVSGRKFQTFWNETNDYHTMETYTKGGGLGVQSTSRDASPQPKQVKEGDRTTTTVNYINTLHKTVPKISRNMNAMGINVGLAYRF